MEHMLAVCPMPMLWMEIHQRLKNAAMNLKPPLDPPPIPLVLAGWNYSNDVQKQERWSETLAWAELHGLARIIGDLPDSAMYWVESPSTYEVGPLGGPMYLQWRFEPARRVTNEEARAAIEKLNEEWETVAGGTLSMITCPLRLSGSKKRRLVVYADCGGSPPWGTWSSMAYGEQRRSFTRLRSAVNAAIAPLTVDHIDFVHTRG
jgi:hypothetical protein